MHFQDIIHNYAIHAVWIALFAWLLRPNRSILKSISPNDSVVVRSPLKVKLFTSFIGLFGVLLALISITMFLDQDGVQWFQAILCTVLSLILILWAIKVIRLRIEANQEQLKYSSPWKTVVSSWSSVISIDTNNPQKGFKFRTRNGSFIVPVNLDNVIPFLQIAHRIRPDLITIRMNAPVIPE